MYKVIVDFIDLQDNNYAYKVGDKFPHNGKNVSEERLSELASDANRRKIPLIQKIEEAETVEPVVEAEVEFMNPPVETVEVETAKEEVTEAGEAEGEKKPRKSKKK